MLYGYSAAPTASPQIDVVTSVIPASLNVSWQPPPEVDHNGPITYVIQYTRTAESTGPTSVNVTSGITYMISGLVAFVDYSVTVAAMNVKGTGPFSSNKTGRSGENGEFQLLASYTIQCSCVFMHVCFYVCILLDNYLL